MPPLWKNIMECNVSTLPFKMLSIQHRWRKRKCDPCWKGKAVNRDQTTDDSNVEFSIQEWIFMFKGQIGNLSTDIESLKKPIWNSKTEKCNFWITNHCLYLID